MSSVNHVARQLAEMGLTVDVDGDFILCEDPGLDFERSHDGVRGISRWLAETREEYKTAVAELFEEDKDEEQAAEKTQADSELMEIALEEEAFTQEEPEVFNFVEAILNSLGRNAQPVADPQEFTPAPPIKNHVPASDQLALAKEMNMGCKETAQAMEIDDQDRGGVPSPEAYITQMKQEVVTMSAVTILVKGQRFMAPEGWKIKESRPSGKVLLYGSIMKGRKLNNALDGSRFSLVRDL